MLFFIIGFAFSIDFKLGSTPIIFLHPLSFANSRTKPLPQPISKKFCLLLTSFSASNKQLPYVFFRPFISD